MLVLSILFLSSKFTGCSSWRNSKVALLWQKRTERLSCCHKRSLRLSAPQLYDSFERTGFRSWKMVGYHQSKCTTRGHRVFDSLPWPRHGCSDGRSGCFFRQQWVPAVRSCIATLNFSFSMFSQSRSVWRWRRCTEFMLPALAVLTAEFVVLCIHCAFIRI